LLHLLAVLLPNGEVVIGIDDIIATLGREKSKHAASITTWCGSTVPSQARWSLACVRPNATTGSRYSIGRSSQQRNTAHYQGTEITIHYPHHPYTGRRATVIGWNRFGDEIYFVIARPNASPFQVPVWMTDPAAAANDGARVAAC
jgi:hypothetical protein